VTIKNFVKISGLILIGTVLTQFGGGCASTQMKGTPFYTGEYSVKQGPVEDRLNLWPLVYYREPALSVLWPIMELSDEHFAIRPLMSIYDRNTDTPTYNVLWPLTQFDTKNENYRIFPFFWGDDYFVGFPLYWHFDHPLDHDGYDGLFPLWSYSSHGKKSYNLHLLWPFINIKHHSDNNHGWRIWPLAGSYNNHGKRYSFAAWPLGNRWQYPAEDRAGSCLLPLYYHQKAGNDSLFLSLPYSRGTQDDTSWETVLPLYHRRNSANTRSFYSLPYSYSENSLTESKWSLAIPLWYSKSSANDNFTATLLGGYRNIDGKKSWAALPLLSGGSSTADSSDTWIIGPLAHIGRDGKSREDHIFPLYYRSQNDTGKRFYSIPWSSAHNSDSSSWQLLPPLMYRQHNSDGNTLITPLYAQGTADGGETRWKSIIPFVFNRKTQNERLVATILGGYRKTEDSLSWMALPLLSGGSTTAGEHSVWALGPIIHARWNDEFSSHHILPLYYRDGESGSFISLPYSHWKSGDTSTTAIPLALSWMTASKDCSSLWLLGPLAHFSWGENADASHIFPLYYHNPITKTTLSPLYMKFNDMEKEYTLMPPLLSMYSQNGNTKNFYSLLGLYRHQWGEKTKTADRLWPLYDYRKDNHFFTPIVGWNHNRDGFIYPLTPLIGIRHGDYSGGWIFPLWSRHRNKLTGDVSGTFLWGSYRKNGNYRGSGIFPFYGYKNYGPKSENSLKRNSFNKKFWSLPYCWYRNRSSVIPEFDEKHNIIIPSATDSRGKRQTKEHGAFPLWSYYRYEQFDKTGATTAKDTKGSILMFLYDYKHEENAAEEHRKCHDYTRRRILWRLWHYEREDGNVSVDIFPGITYDKKTDGFHKFSFIWRLLRYQNGPDGKKADILFIPIIRKKAQ